MLFGVINESAAQKLQLKEIDMTRGRMKQILLYAVLALGANAVGLAHAGEEAKYKADVPASVLTPDTVQTQLLGQLKFFDGMPDEDTIRKSYDFLDVARAAEAFLNGIPAASVYALLEGLKEVGMKPYELGVYEELMDARSLFLTANSTTMYCMTEINVKDGPVVAEVPPEVLGPVDDAYFRFVTDIGLTGPDQGKGGKYLFVHRDYSGPVPGGYFVVRTPTYRNLFFFRAFVKDNDLKGTAAGVKSGFRMYPLAQADKPPRQVVHNLSGKKFNTVHGNDFKFFEELNAVIQYEPADAFDPEIVGQFAAIGIKKGQPFSPDARMRKLLSEGVAIGNAAARFISFSPRKKNVYFWEDRQWTSPFAGMGYEFLNSGERVLDDRIFFHYIATGITPSMAAPKVGTGSVYAFAAKDSKGRYLDGGKNYKVDMPHPIPFNNFWSFMVYSGQHRACVGHRISATVPGNASLGIIQIIPGLFLPLLRVFEHQKTSASFNQTYSPLRRFAVSNSGNQL